MHVVGFGGFSPETLSTVSDGTSNTLLVTEYATRTHERRTTFWAYPHASYWSASPWENSNSAFLLNSYDACATSISNAGTWGTSLCKRGMSSNHSGGFNGVHCDGSVRFFSSTTSPLMLARLANLNGGTVVQID
jgi:prepilin-type processing-associated H-X9-DG protein